MNDMELAEEIERNGVMMLRAEQVKQIIAALRSGHAPVLGECEECGHTIVTPLKRLPERPPSGEDKNGK